MNFPDPPPAEVRRVGRAIAPLLCALPALAMLACGGSSVPSDPDDIPAVCSALAPASPEERFRVSRQQAPVLIENARVMTAAGDRFDPGHVLFSDGAIVAVGPGAAVEVPTDTIRLDADGRWVTPGLIDTHSHIGVYAVPGVQAHSDGNEATAPVTAEVHALHSFWPQDPALERASAGGVTTLHVLPGSANLIGGRSATLRVTRGAIAARDLLFPGAPEGLKMACGENPKRVYGGRGRAPSTRMGNVAGVRQAFLDAQATLRELNAHEEALAAWCQAGARGDAPDAPPRNLQRETLARVLRGEILPQVHCYRADEMRIMLDVAEEFGFSIRSFHHAVEAYKLAADLAARDVATSTWADWWGFKLEAFDAILENAAMLTAAGARAVIHSDSPYDIQRLNQEAAKAYFAGLAAGIELTEDDALRWITANAAWVLGIDDVTGTLEPGKRADIVLWSQHPFSIYAQADYVFVDGVAQTVRGEADHPWSDFELGLWPTEVSP